MVSFLCCIFPLRFFCNICFWGFLDYIIWGLVGSFKKNVLFTGLYLWLFIVVNDWMECWNEMTLIVFFYLCAFLDDGDFVRPSDLP